MVRCLCSILLLSLLALPALAQDLLYDDGGSHLLDSLAPLGPSPSGSVIEVRDGPGPAPTYLEVDLADPVDQGTTLSIDVYGQSSLQLSTAGHAIIQTYDTSSALIDTGCCSPFVPSFTTWDQSVLTVRNAFDSGIARGSSEVVFESGANELYFQGWDDSSSLQLGGVLYNTALIHSATMSVLGGFWGVEGGSVAGDAQLVVDGGTVYDSLSVSGNGQADVHSGSPSASASWSVAGFGIVRLFGSDFTLDGLPIGPGDIPADPGNSYRGLLEGTLESGDALSVPLYITDSGIVQLVVPEPGTGLLLGLALAIVARGGRRAERAS